MVIVVRAGLQPGQHDLAGVVRLVCDEDRPCSLGPREVRTPIVCDMEIDLVIGSGPDNDTVRCPIATRNIVGEFATSAICADWQAFKAYGDKNMPIKRRRMPIRSRGVVLPLVLCTDLQHIQTNKQTSLARGSAPSLWSANWYGLSVSYCHIACDNSVSSFL